MKSLTRVRSFSPVGAWPLLHMKIDIDPIKLLLPDDEETNSITENGLSMLQLSVPTQSMELHFLPSIKSTILIRQLPSQGLSFQLWPAATTLVNLLDLHRCNPTTSPLLPTLTALSNGPDPRPLKILELGSGTGLVGIAAAMTLGAIDTVTDIPHVIPNLQFNVEANVGVLAVQGGAVDAAPLRWGEADDVDAIGRDFDLVLASDVVYQDHLFEPLVKTLRLLLLGGIGDKKMVFVMAHLRRWKKDSVFFKKARKFFDVELLHNDEPCPGSRIGVAVYRFVRRNQKMPASLADKD